VTAFAPALAVAADAAAKDDGGAYDVVLLPAVGAAIVFAIFLVITLVAERNETRAVAEHIKDVRPPSEVNAAAIGGYLVTALAPIATVDGLRDPVVREHVGEVLAHARTMQEERRRPTGRA
jgi:hypothetical protein